MPSIKTSAIVLRYANYRDHDRMLTLLSPTHGRIDVLSRGCRRPKSPLLPASELFVHGEFVVYMQNDHATLSACTLEDSFYPLRLDHYRFTCASYMASLCDAASQAGESAEAMYALLLKGLYYLTYEPDCDALRTTTAFLLCLANILGYRPRLTRCVHCHTTLDLEHGAPLDIEAGGLCCKECTSRSTFFLRKEEIVWISQTLRNGFSAQKENGDPHLFDVFRRYVESRLDQTIRVSRLLP